jgi:hypothetical protein
MRKVIGAIKKRKDGSGDYLEIKEAVAVGMYNLESKASRLKSLEEAVENGKVSEELAVKRRESINKTPDFVRFEIVQYTKDS